MISKVYISVKFSKMLTWYNVYCFLNIFNQTKFIKNITSWRLDGYFKNTGNIEKRTSRLLLQREKENAESDMTPPPRSYQIF